MNRFMRPPSIGIECETHLHLLTPGSSGGGCTQERRELSRGPPGRPRNPVLEPSSPTGRFTERIMEVDRQRLGAGNRLRSPSRRSTVVLGTVAGPADEPEQARHPARLPV